MPSLCWSFPRTGIALHLLRVHGVFHKICEEHYCRNRIVVYWPSGSSWTLCRTASTLVFVWWATSCSPAWLLWLTCWPMPQAKLGSRYIGYCKWSNVTILPSSGHQDLGHLHWGTESWFFVKPLLIKLVLLSLGSYLFRSCAYKMRWAGRPSLLTSRCCPSRKRWKLASGRALSVVCHATTVEPEDSSQTSIVRKRIGPHLASIQSLAWNLWVDYKFNPQKCIVAHLQEEESRGVIQGRQSTLSL